MFCAARAIATAYDFSTVSQLVDVGGGSGVLLAAILKRHLQLNGILLDLSRATAQALQYLKLEGLAERCEIIQGDFFESVPSGGELYLLSQIIHDWDDVRAG